MPSDARPPTLNWLSSPSWVKAYHFGGGPVLGPLSLCESDISRIVEMAWEDRTAFEAIEVQYGLNESGVIALMRGHMKPSSFRMWRKRMAGRRTKHAALCGTVFLRHCA